MKRKDEPNKNGRFSTAVSIFLVVVGLALVLYPTVARRINQAANGRAIEDYRQKVELTDADEYEQMLAAVEDYNAELADRTPYIADLTNEKRKLYESLLNVAGNGIIGYIEIPKADVYLAVYHGTEESVLQTGVGHLEGSSLPAKGESVHTVLTGHSGLPSARLFTDIDQLQIGDTFTLHVLNEKLTYQVEEIQRILPEDLEDMRIERGRELCTLITCTPYGVNTHRLLVRGSRTEPGPEPETWQDAPHKEEESRNFMPYVLTVGVLMVIIVILMICIHARHGRKR